MTPHEVEEHLKNIDAGTTAIEHFLPTLATKDDLRLTTEALQHEIETGFEAAKAHADRLNEVRREQIRIVADQVARVAGHMATKEELQLLQRTLSAQITALGVSRRRKQR